MGIICMGALWGLWEVSDAGSDMVEEGEGEGLGDARAMTSRPPPSPTTKNGTCRIFTEWRVRLGGGSCLLGIS